MAQLIVVGEVLWDLIGGKSYIGSAPSISLLVLRAWVKTFLSSALWATIDAESLRWPQHCPRDFPPNLFSGLTTRGSALNHG